ncbi:MAG TPA: hypothetical protein VGE13_04350 [Candidatus Saccharimonadales bacterium]
MAKKQSRKPVKKSIRHRINTYNFFLILAVLLGMIAGVLMVKAFYQGEKLIRNSTPTVTLGMLEYEVKDEKAIKKSTSATTSLRAFLEERAAEDCTAIHADMEPSQYSVVAANDDVSQVLLGYGCGDLSSRMFAVRKDNNWRFISPTNQFDPLTNLPLCAHVKENSISKKIAPVCYTVKDTEESVKYVVR